MIFASTDSDIFINRCSLLIAGSPCFSSAGAASARWMAISSPSAVF